MSEGNGNGRPKTLAGRAVEVISTGVIVAAIVGMGGYLFAIPQIKQSLENNALVTQIKLDYLSSQLAEFKTSWKEGQIQDRSERDALNRTLEREVENLKKRIDKQ